MVAKYGNFDWEHQTPEQKTLELETRDEHLVGRADKKVIIFDMLVDVAEKEYDIRIRKNYKPELSTYIEKNTKKH